MPSVVPPVVGGLVGPGVQTIKDAFTYLKGKYDNVKKIKKKFQILQDTEKSLRDTKSELQKKIIMEKIHKEPTPQANTWLQQVEEKKSEVEQLKTKYENVHKCLCGMWPFFKLMKLSKDIMKKTEELEQFKAKIDVRNALMEKKPEAVERKLAGNEDDIPPSLAETVDQLLKFLRDEDVKRIGIWGMAGVGKSTILRRLNDKAGDLGMFEIIIWVKVEEEDTVKNIQSEILARLNLSVQCRDRTEHVADIISKALKEQNYLLLLDQVHGEINLNEVGIRNKCGKVVIASRDKVNCDTMEVDRLIKVNRLSDDDAWELFQKFAGGHAHDTHFKGTADRILKELGGLPQAIKAVANRLKGETETVWNCSLSELQSPKKFGRHMKELYKAFEFSYNKLLGDDSKKCLLFGALFPGDYEIDKDYLTECWRSEQFFSDIELPRGEKNPRKVRASRDYGAGIVRELTEATLLEWRSEKNFLTMPTAFRKIALSFPYPQEGGSSQLVKPKEGLDSPPKMMKWTNARSSSQLVKPKEGLDSPPEMMEWTNARRISLMCNELASLLEVPECPIITTLLLQGNKQLVAIHDSFFSFMPELRVLDLHDTKIQSLPSSIITLVNLKALYLNQCLDLVSLSEDLGKLINLEILDIQDTGMQSLPIEVAQLVNLRCLRFSLFKNPRKPTAKGDHNVGNEDDQQIGMIIPRNLIGSLQHLEELTIIVNPKENGFEQAMGSAVQEIISLKSLTSLFFYFPNVGLLTTFTTESVAWNNTRTTWGPNSFRAFRIIVGSNGENHNNGLYTSRGPAERHLRFSADENVCCRAIQKVLGQSSAFELIGNQEIQNLSDIDIDCMKSLKVCVIDGCDQVSSVIRDMLDTEKNAFPFLEQLNLVNLKNLCCIWDGSAGPNSFSNLTVLTVEGCHKLRSFFSWGVSEKLKKLQRLKIQNCSGIEEVIIEEVNRTEIEEVRDLTGFLPKLEVLELVNLPRLASICNNDSLDWHSLQKIKIIGCCMLNTWSKGMYNAKHISKIECQESWWKNLQIPEEKKRQLTNRCYFIREEPPSVYYTPGEDGIHQAPDLHDLANTFEENWMRHANAFSKAKSSNSQLHDSQVGCQYWKL